MTAKLSPQEYLIRRWTKKSPNSAAPVDERAHQLADIAASGDKDNAECAAADLFRESPSLP